MGSFECHTQRSSDTGASPMTPSGVHSSLLSSPTSVGGGSVCILFETIIFMSLTFLLLPCPTLTLRSDVNSQSPRQGGNAGLHSRDLLTTSLKTTQDETEVPVPLILNPRPTCSIRRVGLVPLHDCVDQPLAVSDQRVTLHDCVDQSFAVSYQPLGPVPAKR